MKLNGAILCALSIGSVAAFPHLLDECDSQNWMSGTFELKMAAGSSNSKVVTINEQCKIRMYQRLNGGMVEEEYETPFEDINDGVLVNQYQPGSTYTIVLESTDLRGFKFGVFQRGTGTPEGAMSPNSFVFPLAPPTNREDCEGSHEGWDAASTDNTFRVDWTAPSEDMGDLDIVTLCAVVDSPHYVNTYTITAAPPTPRPTFEYEFKIDTEAPTAYPTTYPTVGEVQTSAYPTTYPTMPTIVVDNEDTTNYPTTYPTAAGDNTDTTNYPTNYPTVD